MTLDFLLGLSCGVGVGSMAMFWGDVTLDWFEQRRRSSEAGHGE
jgi:hypothetical protein